MQRLNANCRVAAQAIENNDPDLMSCVLTDLTFLSAASGDDGRLACGGSVLLKMFADNGLSGIDAIRQLLWDSTTISLPSTVRP